MTTCPDCQHTFDSNAVPGGHCPRCRFMGGAHEAASLQAPLPDCEIVDLIAHGGMGDVYRATQPTLERVLAVKVMTAQAATPELAARFRREALVLARLQHPNIVPIHALGTDEDGQPYYTMKLVKGRTLQAILDDLRKGDAGTLRHHSLAQLLSAFRKVCDALAFAHAQGILHRDLKPDNVMIGEFGEVLVMDWGLAKLLRSNDEFEAIEAGNSEFGIRNSSFTAPHDSAMPTIQGAVLGTPQFMSPEQAAGQVGELDERSDIYSLGAVLYAILTLRPPVEGTTVAEVLEKVKTGTITSPEQGTGLAKSRPGHERHLASAAPWPIPASLSAVAMKALALDKVQRYPGVTTLIADVEAYQGGFATTAEKAGTLKQLILLMRRHRTVTASLAVLLLLSVGFMLKLMSSEQRALAGEQSAQTSAALAVQEKETARRALTQSALTLAEAGLREGNGLIMQSALDSVPEDLRDPTWRYLLEQSDTSSTQLGMRNGAAAHPHRPGVFAITWNNTVMLLDLQSGTTMLEFDLEPRQHTTVHRFIVSFAPDGESLAVAHLHTAGIIVYRTADGQMLRALDVPPAARFDFSPDGRWLLLLGENGRGLTLCDSSTGHVAWSLTDKAGAQVTFGAFTANGQQVLIAGAAEGLRVVNAQDGSLVRTLPASRAAGTMLAVSASGLVAVSDVMGHVSSLDLKDDTPLAEFILPAKLSTTANDFLGFTPAGDQIVTALCRRDGSRDFRVWNARTGKTQRVLLGGSGLLRQVAIHPRSGELLATGETTHAWNLASTPARWQLPSPRLLDDVFFWGTDDLLFISGSSNKAQLRTLASDNPAMLWKTSTTSSSGAASVSADGRVTAFYERSATSREIVVLRQPGPQVTLAARFAAPPNTPTLIRLSPTGDRLAFLSSAGGLRLLILDAMSGASLVSPELGDTRQIWNLAWINGGRQFAGLTTAVAFRGLRGAEERLVVWDALSGKIVRSAIAPAALNVLVVSPDGSRLAEAGEEKSVRIRAAATLAVVQEFRAHNDTITALAWHPTQPIFATGSEDLTVKLWNLDTGKCLHELRGPLTTPARLTFSPGGTRLGCASANDAVRIWEIETAAASSPAASFPAAGKDRGKMFDLIDKEQHGKLTREFYLSRQTDAAAATKRFDQFDADKDGFMTREEFIKMGKMDQ